MQRHLQAAITAPVKVEIAPQPSFNKLWEKISAAENAELSTANKETTLKLSLKHVGEWLRHYWMPVTLSIQAAAIIALIGVLALRTHSSSHDEGMYRTVTSSAATSGAVIHVVFDDAIRLADIKDILLRSNLQVSSGPTAAGVYSLTSASKDISAHQAVKSLRDDPRVRFAGLSHE
jgi:hypothetical protein